LAPKRKEKGNIPFCQLKRRSSINQFFERERKKERKKERERESRAAFVLQISKTNPLKNFHKAPKRKFFLKKKDEIFKRRLKYSLQI
jgi:hypothetical protein